MNQVHNPTFWLFTYLYSSIINNWNNNKIVKGCVKHNPEARKVLYKKYSSQMFSICLRYANNASDAEDIFQESFYLVYKNISQLRDEKALSGWVKRIFVNTALEYNRKANQLRVVGDDEVHYEGENIELNSVIEQIALDELTQLIQELPTGCRMVFNMYVIDGYSHKEIAEQMEISVGTSKSQLFDARKILQQKVIDRNGNKKVKTSS